MDFITQSWSWYVSGPMISLVLLLLFYFGRSFGVSTNLETFCTIGGAGKITNYFNLNWKERAWSLLFVVGIVIGGYISYNFLMDSTKVNISSETIQSLKQIGFNNPGSSYLPSNIFSAKSIFSVKGFFILIGGGFLIGFGSRYAGGCTSGHSILGLSSLQPPSLLATIGFFIGGLLMTWLIIPILF
ncbi:YeeE/YedE thiosulfate transporter family protein [Tenacibaculum sp.]|nr:YeeE/YedE thiosulfate transporter family protein [Tenacibaculum sp.]